MNDLDTINFSVFHFSETDVSCLRACLKEICYGYAAIFLQNCIKTNTRIFERFLSDMDAHNENDTSALTSISKNVWLDVYNGVNAVIYELGPEELLTLTGHSLVEIISLNRKIFCVCHQRYIISQRWE